MPPDREALLDELGRVFARCAVDALFDVVADVESAGPSQADRQRALEVKVARAPLEPLTPEGAA